jgi:hypothetical protein
VNSCEHSNEPLDAVQSFSTNDQLSAPFEELCFFKFVSGSWLKKSSCQMMWVLIRLSNVTKTHII